MECFTATFECVAVISRPATVSVPWCVLSGYTVSMSGYTVSMSGYSVSMSGYSVSISAYFPTQRELWIWSYCY